MILYNHINYKNIKHLPVLTLCVSWWCGKRFSGNYLNQGPGQEGSYVMECSYMLYISVCYKTLFTHLVWNGDWSVVTRVVTADLQK